MPEDYLRQSALASLGLAAKAVAQRTSEQGVALRELPPPALVNLRLAPDETALVEALKVALDLELPALGRSSQGNGLVAYRLGPDEWWIRTAGSADDLAVRMRRALAGGHAAVTEIGEGWTQIEVSGPQSRALLAKACPLDFHPRAFSTGEVKQSLLSKADAVYRLISDEDGGTGDRDIGAYFEITVRRSFADYTWRWLADAAGEYGLAVLI